MLFTTSTCNYFNKNLLSDYHNKFVCSSFRKPAVKEEILSKLRIEAEANLGYVNIQTMSSIN